MQAGMTKCPVDVLLFLKFHFKTRHTRQEGGVQSLQNLALRERCWELLIFFPQPYSTAGESEAPMEF